MIPKVSIIIPIYNVENYVVECLQSVADQTFSEIQVICIDDASTDNSYEVAKRFIDSDSRFELIQLSENKGLSFVRNRGMESAKGKYLYFLDSDDYLEINAMEVLFSYAEEKNLQGVFCGSKVIYENEKKVRWEMGYRKFSNQVCTGKQFFIKANDENEYYNAVWMQFWKREYIIDHSFKFYEGIFHEDILYSLQILLDADRVVCINENLHIYRKRKGSITDNHGITQVKSYMIVYYEVLKLWMNMGCQKEIGEGIKKRLNLFHRRIYMTLRENGNILNIEFEDEACNYLYKKLAVTVPEYEYIEGIDEEIEQCIDSFSGVIVYGAGLVANEVISLLEKKHKNIIGVAVTHKKEQDYFMGYPIYELEEMKEYIDTAIIVLATSSNYHKEIIEHISKKGFSNYIIMK
ncbi:glycosyltransferase [Kineothrix sp. MB12-C1]|uniref:glycosyltransferase n=1 Tax=Kineothrix sp. MB12-C1 TaxID=3070215 RepID=UPI0027D34A50|nr:glycosyltransferase [Kineothrix sp. MB12-C1]WMC93867.1 glycosyltransferase [Kineothrix sp. MB12-C1]